MKISTIIKKTVCFSTLFMALGVMSCGMNANKSELKDEHSDEWRNIGPIVSDDMKAFVDYKISKSVPDGDICSQIPNADVCYGGPVSYQKSTEPIWVNIHQSDLSPNDKVFVQIISYERSCYRGDCVNVQSISERDLDFAETGRFTGQMKPLTLDYYLNDSYAVSTKKSYKQEIVVWINGRLYKDSAGHNLRLNMM